jgi:hypothetical protein
MPSVPRILILLLQEHMPGEACSAAAGKGELLRAPDCVVRSSVLLGWQGWRCPLGLVFAQRGDNGPQVRLRGDDQIYFKLDGTSS